MLHAGGGGGIEEVKTELAYESKLQCRMCGYRTKGFQDHLAALTEMSNHLVYCLRLFEDNRAVRKAEELKKLK